MQETIRKQAERALKMVAAIEPPAPLMDIYDIQKLKSSTFAPEAPEFLELTQQIGADAQSLRGCLFVQDNLVITRDDGYPQRNNFVLAHELGHFQLPWHKALLYKCTQFDLSAKANKQLEREANFFASEICFMGEHFTDQLQDSALSIRTLVRLADRFNMSKEATFRRAVELERRPCLLIRFTANEQSDAEYLKIDYIIYSNSFTEQFGQIDHRQVFSKQHVLAQVLADPLASLSNYFEGEITMRDTKQQLRLESWKNRWNVFALCTPKVT
ncbi:TPA: ImmA/IrrE family metallo-endopeptidase [Burkholderia multivorans]|nr:ImmA/IrrE family metallo-endopeptidase [Burkholderia multivorans]